VLDFPLRNKNDGEHAAQDDTVNIADVITDDDATAALHTPFFADNRHLNVENRAHKESKTAA
jgi:hypothetical protein